MKVTAEQIKEYNLAYRLGKPLISDSHYDSLLEQFKRENSTTRYQTLLNELALQEYPKIPTGYIRKKVMGSFNKIKAEDKISFEKWSAKYSSFFVTGKLDGVSFELVVTPEGKSLYSRGDGYTGENWTSKIPFIKGFNREFPLGIYRGELVLTSNEEYANKRSGIVGIMNSQEVYKHLFKYVEPIFYRIFSEEKEVDIILQYTHFDSLDLRMPPLRIFSKYELGNLEVFLEDIKKNNPDIDFDGLVIFGLNENLYGYYGNEYYPEHAIAFKKDSEGIETMVKAIEWSTSKTGTIKPVLLLDPPVELLGTKVSRVTGNNYRWLESEGIASGSKVVVIKSGDVIPKVQKVTLKANIREELPTIKCECGEDVILGDTDISCNQGYDCPFVQQSRVLHFLKNLDIDGAGEGFLANNNIYSISDLVAFSEKEAKNKSQEKVVAQLQEKMYTKSKVELLSCMSFDGIAESTLYKLMGSMDYEEFISRLPYSHEHLILKNRYLFQINNHDVSIIITSQLWNPNTTVGHLKKLQGVSFCLTGTFAVSRKELEKIIKEQGGRCSSSVSKTLDYLVVGADAGSKLSTAKKLGIVLITEAELLKLIEE